MSVPSTFFINRNIPQLFSFTEKLNKASDDNLSQSLAWFEGQKDFLNTLASGNQVISFKIDDYLEGVDRFLESSSLEQKIRLGLAAYLIYSSVARLKDIELADAFFQYTHDAFESLSPENKTEAIWWYYACLLKYRANLTGNFDLKLINKTVDCIENIKSNFHKEGLFIFIIRDYYPRSTEYPDYEPLARLESIFPSHPFKLDGYCASLRHKFIIRQLRTETNRCYFDIETSYLLNEAIPTTKKDLELKISAEESICSEKSVIKIAVDERSLFKFLAHIISPSPPMIKIEAPELTTEDCEIHLRQRLRTAGFCSGEGFLDVALIKKQYNQFKEVAQRALVEYCNLFLQKQLNIKEFETHFNPAIIIPQLEKLDKIRESLEGFNVLDAVFLFHESLVLQPYGLDPGLLQSVKRTVCECLEILYQSRAATQLDDFKKHAKWFEIAKQIVNSLKRNPRNMLIKIGTPIEDKSYSDHAFYVSIKHLPNSNNFQIIITNGGSNVSRFHTISSAQRHGDRKEYYYAAFQQFDINKCEEALVNYLYLSISLEYRCSISDKEELELFWMTEEIFLGCGPNHAYYPALILNEEDNSPVKLYTKPGNFVEIANLKDCPISAINNLLQQNKDKWSVSLDDNNPIFKWLINIGCVLRDNPDSYLNLLRSLYLRENIKKPGSIESFKGFQYKEFTTFKRQDLDDTFLSQFTGNCTIHNLKKSLQILFGMNQLTFGLLEDRAVIGLNQVIYEFLGLSIPTAPVNIIGGKGASNVTERLCELQDEYFDTEENKKNVRCINNDQSRIGRSNTANEIEKKSTREAIMHTQEANSSVTELKKDSVPLKTAITKTSTLFKAIFTNDIDTVVASIKALNLQDQNIPEPDSGKTLYEILLTLDKKMQNAIFQAIEKNQNAATELEKNEALMEQVVPNMPELDGAWESTETPETNAEWEAEEANTPRQMEVLRSLQSQLKSQPEVFEMPTETKGRLEFELSQKSRTMLTTKNESINPAFSSYRSYPGYK